jgi:hypothetical protein
MAENIQNEGLEADSRQAEREIKAVAEQVKQKTSEVATEAQRQARDIAVQVEAEAKGVLSERQEKAAAELHGIATALRQTSNQLREQQQPTIADYGNRVADRVEQLSSFLQSRHPDELIVEAQDFARRQPELFLGGAFLLGLLGARFIKSSSPGYGRDDTTYPLERRAMGQPAAGQSYTLDPQMGLD